MHSEEIRGIAEALGRTVVATRTLAGGFSHETSLLTLADDRVVARLGGSDPVIEAAVMSAARRHVPVPRVLRVLPSTGGEDTRPAMVLEYVEGRPLDRVLFEDEPDGAALGELGAEVGRTVAGIGAVAFDRRGFFTDGQLAVREEPPWSQQLPEVAAACMDATPQARLDPATRRAWADLCTLHAPALTEIDSHTRLVHSDINPKNILVTRARGAWRVSAVLDWEFSYSGCPYADPANMVRFGAHYPARFLDGFRTGFAEHRPADLAPVEEWGYLGRIMDMFALSDLVTRPLGHPVAEQAAEVIRRWIAEGVPRSL